MEELPSSPEYRKTGNTAELYSSIRIRANPGQIWKILADFPGYPEWNPFIRRIEGTLREGERITAELRPEGGTGITIHPLLVTVVPDREIRWKGHLLVPGLLDGEHVLGIEPVGGEFSLFVQHEYFSGLLLPLFELLMKNGTARGFDAMNRALKSRAGQGAEPVSPGRE
jgi:hypothetical protein